MSLCTYQKQCELRSSRQWWWDGGVVKMSKYFKKRSPNVAPLDSTICIIAMPSSMCTVDGLTRWNRKLRNACINTRIRVYKYTKIRDEHGASFQSSLKINRMLITRPICIQRKISYPHHRSLLFSLACFSKARILKCSWFFFSVGPSL